MRYKKEPIGSILSLSRALKVSENQLISIAENSDKYWQPGPTKIAPGKKPRKTNDATDPLKSLHKMIKIEILDHVEFPAYIMGGVASDEFNKRDYISHAKSHAGKKLLISEDIKSFYPSTKEEIVNDIWQCFFGFHPEVAKLLTQITTHKGILPQGWIPSTHLANLALWRHEPGVVKRLKESGFMYTRFIDDMSISSDVKVQNKIKTEVISELIGMMRKSGYSPKRSKHNLINAGGRMRAVNLNVDRENPTIPKSVRDEIRAAVHKCVMCSPTARNCREYIKLWDKASGRVSNLKLVHPKQADLLRAKLTKIRPQRQK